VRAIPPAVKTNVVALNAEEQVYVTMVSNEELERHSQISMVMAKMLDALLDKYPNLDSAGVILNWQDPDLEPLMGVWRTQDGPAFPQILNGDIQLAEIMESCLQEWLNNIRAIKESVIKADLSHNGLDNATEPKEESSQATPQEQARPWDLVEEVETLHGPALARDVQQYLEEVEGRQPKARDAQDVGGAGKDSERSFTLSDYSFD
jgi:fibronectin type 3 domain-containing protein